MIKRYINEHLSQLFKCPSYNVDARINKINIKRKKMIRLNKKIYGIIIPIFRFKVWTDEISEWINMNLEIKNLHNNKTVSQKIKICYDDVDKKVYWKYTFK